MAALWLAVWAAAGWAQEGPTAIYAMNADGSEARRLVKVDGYTTHSFPRWSHDGRWIVFDAVPKAGQRELFLMNADGKGLRKLGIGSTPSWSPDDKQIGFYFFGVDGRPQVAVQNLDLPALLGNRRPSFELQGVWARNPAMLAGLNDVGQDSVRRITMRRSLLLGLVLSAVFLLGLTWPSDAAARQMMRRLRPMNNRAVKAMNTAEVIHALRSAHALLIKADHDYDGHRALAAKEVQKALSNLGHKKPLAGASVNTGSASATKAAHTGKAGARETQATSDAQLRQAQQLLQTALPHIQAATHPKAAGNVQAAISQIATALSVK